MFGYAYIIKNPLYIFNMNIYDKIICMYYCNNTLYDKNVTKGWKNMKLFKFWIFLIKTIINKLWHNLLFCKSSFNTVWESIFWMSDYRCSVFFLWHITTFTRKQAKKHKKILDLCSFRYSDHSLFELNVKANTTMFWKHYSDNQIPWTRSWTQDQRRIMAEVPLRSSEATGYTKYLYYLYVKW